MLLAWNYTIELFFWIVLGAVILVSLTILLAGPGFRSKKSETSEETLLLTGESVDSPEGSILDRDAMSSRVEEELEILEEIEKGETEQDDLSLFVRIRAYAIVIAYATYSSIVAFYGVIVVYWEIYYRPENSLDQSFISILLGITFSLTGVSSLYGFIIEDKKWLRYSCRMTAVVFLLLIVLVSGGAFLEFFGFVIIPLLFSGDLKLLWMRVSSSYMSMDMALRNQGIIIALIILVTFFLLRFIL